MTKNNKSNSVSGKGKRKKGRIILFTLLLFLIIFRLMLPPVVKYFANKSLAEIPGYFGHVEDIDIALVRGAYRLNNIYINKTDTVNELQTPFFRSDVIDLSIEWNALLHGMIAGEIVLDRPQLRFTKDRAEPAQVKKDSAEFRVLLDKFIPLKINRFEINHGIIAYRDSSSTPPVNLMMNETYILAENLKSAYNENLELPATVKAKAYLYEGSLTFDMKLNPLSKQPAFDMNAELKDTDLPKLNDFFKAYGNFDVHEGKFGLFAEMATKDGKFKGYVKPVITNLDVVGPEDRHNSILNKIWERVVGAVGVIFRNQPKDQLASKIPIEGNFKNPEPSVLDAIGELLVNAFVQALIPSIDHEINLKSVKDKQSKKKNFFQKLFVSTAKEPEKK